MNNMPQPEIIAISDSLRLRKYDGNYEIMLAGYQDPYVYQNSEGIFDENQKPDLDYVKGMCEFLDRAGELYFIEVKENDSFISIGDVTVKAENPPIAIWVEKYRGVGIGSDVMKAVIDRLKELGVKKISGSTVFKWNLPSQRLHQKLGFQCVSENEKEYIYNLDIVTENDTGERVECYTCERSHLL